MALRHESGRLLIPCDNTTAVWAYTLALESETPTLEEVTATVAAGGIPFTFRGLRGRFARFYAMGWKLAHIEDVGLNTRAPLESLPIAVLEAHFRKLVMPSNMFAVPKHWAGLGEVPEIIDAFRAAAAREGQNLNAPEATQGDEVLVENVARDLARAAVVPQIEASNEARPVASYEASRLLFKSAIIDPLEDDELFQVVTPQGVFAMTKRQFLTTFRNVVETSSYRDGGVYSYSTTPAKALQYLRPRRP